MATSHAERGALLARTLPQRRETVRLLEDYLSRTGLAYADFARRINYSKIAVSFFASGRYHRIAGDDSAIRAAITDFIAAHPIAPLTQTCGKLYETENVRLVRRCFTEALDGRAAYYFRGAPGSQKTFVLQHLIADLNRAEASKNGSGRRAYYIYCLPDTRPTQLLKQVAEAAGSISTGDKHRILRNLRFDIGQRKAILVFDEAQHLDPLCLETLRALHDLPPHCGLLFAGSHEIEKTFQRLDMEQWNSRIRQGRELPGVSEDEAAEIIRAELGPKANVKFVIKNSYATDLRKGHEAKYISARTLFWSIQAIQAARDKTSSEEATPHK